MHILAKKGPKDKRIRITVRCFDSPVPWLWNIIIFLKAVEVMEVGKDYEGEVDISCQDRDRNSALVTAVHRLIGKGGVPFLWWTKYPTDCLIVDRDRNVWMLHSFITRNGEQLIPCQFGMKDISAFRAVAQMLAKRHTSSHSST